MEEKTYSIAENGEERGEYTLDEIIAMVDSGQIEVANAVYLDPQNRWSALGKIVNSRLQGRETVKRALAVSTTAAQIQAPQRVTHATIAIGYSEPAAVILLRAWALIQFGLAVVFLFVGSLEAMNLCIVGAVSAVAWLCVAQVIGYLAKIEFNTRK